jgi:DNA end-binding protein Ku
VDEMIERKSRGEVITTDGQKAEPAPVVDLMEALRASVEAARAKRQAGGDADAQPESEAGDTDSEAKPAKKKSTKASKAATDEDEAVAS